MDDKSILGRANEGHGMVRDRDTLKAFEVEKK
jgi:hypothetical protein